MPVVQKAHPVDPFSVRVQRESRDRRELDQDHIRALADSIKARGQISPITITRDLVLVAGECRLEAGKLLRHDDTSFTLTAFFVDELTPEELKILELEENVKRRNLSWQEEALAIFAYHETRIKQSSKHSIERTAEEIGLSLTHVNRNIHVGRELRAGNERVRNASGIRNASQIIEKEFQRKVDTALSHIDAESFGGEEEIEDAAEGWAADSEGAEPTGVDRDPSSPRQALRTGARPTASGAALSEPDIFVGDFLAWAPKFSGRRFNLLHCDFPYGLNIDQAQQGNVRTYNTYKDSPELYWQLCACLATNLDRILLPSAHVVFWFSMKYYQETLDFFSTNTDLKVDPFPLIWLKSDNKGFLPDHKRGPRRVYETAFIMSRGDRFIIAPVQNGYSAPTEKVLAEHLSEKPEPVLRHFLKMFCDGLSEVLDPTCGAGSALRAAESLGAKRVVGMDISAENVQIASERLMRARKLRNLAQAV